jgi:hypothetical protein
MSVGGTQAVLLALAAVGLRADPAWVASTCSKTGPADAVADELLAAATRRDLRKIVSAGSLPPINTDSARLAGPFLLQVSSCEDVSQPQAERAAAAAASGGAAAAAASSGLHRALKLHITDGRQEVFAFELRKITSAPAPIPVGAKLLVKSVDVRHGLLLLTTENTLYLGGSFDAEHALV